jgi:hypothetical protein
MSILEEVFQWLKMNEAIPLIQNLMFIFRFTNI